MERGRNGSVSHVSPDGQTTPVSVNSETFLVGGRVTLRRLALLLVDLNPVLLDVGRFGLRRRGLRTRGRKRKSEDEKNGTEESHDLYLNRSGAGKLR